MRRVAWLVPAAALLLIAGCGGRGAPPPPNRILIASASSLRELLETTARRFEQEHPGSELAFSFEASSTLARKISEGAPFDAFLSADAETLDRVREQCDAATVAPFLSNRLALVSRRGIEHPAESPRALPDHPGTIALAGPAVPAGRYARAFLDRTGVLARIADRVVDAPSVRAVLALVESGAADYGLVYATDMNGARTAKLLWTDREREGPPIAYVAGALRRSGSPSARAYVAWLRSGPFLSAAEGLGFERYGP